MTIVAGIDRKTANVIFSCEACDREMVNLINTCRDTIKAHAIASLAYRASHGVDDPERVSHG
jgi:hypothetical protein